MNTFSIEHGNGFVKDVCFMDNNGIVPHEEISVLTFEELSNYDKIDYFIEGILAASEQLFGESNEEIYVTLVGEDGYFIWGVCLIPNGEYITYQLIDWTKDEQLFKYEGWDNDEN